MPPLKEAALWVAAASALAYLIGSLYLGSYYAKFGLPETEIDFSVPYVMSSSLIPLILPAFWLALVAAACRFFSRRMLRPTWASAFFPIPAVKAVAYTLSFCALNTALAANGVVWLSIAMGWSLRGIVVVLLGVISFAATFLKARREHRAGPPPRVSPSTMSMLWMVSIALAVGILSLFTGRHAWPYSRWQNGFFGAVIVIAAGFWAWDFRKARLEIANTGEWETKSLGAGSPPSNPPATIFFSIIATLALLLNAGLSGTAAAGEIIEGCSGATTVQFSPSPEGLPNETLLLVLHANQRYYVVPANGSGLRIVSESPGLIATLGWQGPTGSCGDGP